MSTQEVKYYIVHMVFLSLGRYLRWWNISPRGYHSSSSQCIDPDMVYYIFIYYCNLQLLNMTFFLIQI
jgi:hypothetical protein